MVDLKVIEDLTLNFTYKVVIETYQDFSLYFSFNKNLFEFSEGDLTIEYSILCKKCLLFYICTLLSHNYWCIIISIIFVLSSMYKPYNLYFVNLFITFQ